MKAEASLSLLSAMIAAADPELVEWLCERTLLGGVSTRTGARPRLVVDNSKEGRVR
jgi:hypothetical protein